MAKRNPFEHLLGTIISWWTYCWLSNPLLIQSIEALSPKVDNATVDQSSFDQLQRKDDNEL